MKFSRSIRLLFDLNQKLIFNCGAGVRRVGGMVVSARMMAAGAGAACLLLGGCASPYFVHDPRMGFVSPEQVPVLLKSLRCELATFAAANNQHQIIHLALIDNKVVKDPDPAYATANFPFFELDPGAFGGVALDLKIQDTLGTQSGTAFDWKRAAQDNKIHSWHLGPTLSDQSTYDALLSFVARQDVYRMGPILAEDSRSGFLCYNGVPKRDVSFQTPQGIISFDNSNYELTFPLPTNTRTYAEGYPVQIRIEDLQQDLDRLAAGETPEYENFSRIRVNGTTPLAAWLQQVSTNISSTSLVHTSTENTESMPSGQMTYTFTIQVTAGLDVKGLWTTTLWTAVGGEALASAQHTSTLTLVINGVNASYTAGARSGSATRVAQRAFVPLNYAQLAYTPMPLIARRSQKVTKGSNKFLKFNFDNKKAEVPAQIPQRKSPFKPDYAQPGKARGSLIYPLVPLSPLGAPGQ